MVMVPYLIGVVTAPLFGKIVKPLVQGAIKTTTRLALQVKKVATEAVEDLRDLSAELAATETEPRTQPRTSVREGSKSGARQEAQ